MKSIHELIETLVNYIIEKTRNENFQNTGSLFGEKEIFIF